MLVSVGTPDPEPADPRQIAELVAKRTELHPNGEDQLRGACPFCRSMAFLVRPRHGTFHCFGCGEGGDARIFAAKARHLP